MPEMGVCLLVGMPSWVFREVWKEEADTAETVQEGEWGMKAIGYVASELTDSALLRSRG